jgi:proteasome lid subunit RPN8/RPN11
VSRAGREEAARTDGSAAPDGARRGEGDVLRIPAEVRARILRHAARAYPEEGCGVLLGSDGRPRRVARAIPVENARDRERGRRYLIDPMAVRAAQRAAGNAGLQVVGFYHSHPDHPAEPSAFDRDHAWPWYSYVIVPAAAAGAGEPRAWRLRDDRTGFDEQEISE